VPASDALEISDCLLTFIFPDPPRCLECAVRFAQLGYTALHYAVAYGHHSIVGMLLAAEADTSKNSVSDALIPLLPPPPSTVVPLTHRRQAQRKQQLNSRPVCGVWGSGGTSLCSARNRIISRLCRVAPLL
jgi:ankyrin repeat protein